MKKIIFLIVLIMLGSGCYDYVEINDLALVTGLSVDYSEGEFKVAFEILTTKNKEKESDSNEVYFAKGYGDTFADAFYNTALSVAKTPYLAHLKVVIVSEETAKYYLEDMIDFLLRDNNIRGIFYLTVAKDVSAYEIISNANESNPVVSNTIAKMLEDTTYLNNIASDANFENLMAIVLDEHQDGYLSSIEIENGTIKLGPLGVLEKYQFKGYLTNEESATFNLIKGTSKEYHFKVNCPNSEEQFITFTTTGKQDSDFKIDNLVVKLSMNVELRIIESHCNLDFKDTTTYEVLETLASDELKEKVKEVVKKSKSYNSDILKIGNLYYQKTKDTIDFKTLDYLYNIKTIINRNGLIFEVR